MANKESIFSKIKNEWNSMSSEAKNCICGSALGGFIFGIGCGIWHKKEMNKLRELNELDCTKSYFEGRRDGQMDAYRELLLNTENAFGKLGMKVEKF